MKPDREVNEEGDISSTREVSSQEMYSFLKMFGPHTHSIECRGRLRDRLVGLGFIEWVPAMFGSNHQYEITEMGKCWRDLYGS